MGTLVLQLGSKDIAEGKTTPSQITGTVLVVDDNEDLLAVLEEVLASRGFTVMTASSGNDALDLLENSLPDIIISDVMMNNMDGYELHQRIRTHDEWCQIPFIFLTALGGADEVRKGKAIGCDDYIIKPFDPQDLVSIVSGKLERFKHREMMSGEKLELYRRRIIHTLSHEFRTPLVAINTGSELIMDQKDNLDEERLESLIGSIYRGGQRLQRLVEDFMTLQQIDSGAAASTCDRLQRKVSLVRVLNAAVEGYIEDHDQEDLQIDFKQPDFSPSTMPNCQLYDMQIVDALHRVINNAFKFANSGDGIVIRMDRSDDCASIFVRDFGPGLPEEMHDSACQIFTQIDREKKEQQGCGLGLTIASYYSELNGGNVYFHRPAEGSGLEVELRFPLVD